MSYSIDLSGRVALVTGASSGLGTQFAKTLSRAGCAVVLAGRRVERLKTLRAEIEAGGGDAHVVELDVTDLASIKAAVAHAETEMGTIDILINNSGVSTTQKLVDVTEEDYDFVFDTNTKGAFFVAQEVGKRMLARAKGAAPGTFTGGRIVNIASMAGLRVLGQHLGVQPCGVVVGVAGDAWGLAVYRPDAPIKAAFVGPEGTRDRGTLIELAWLSLLDEGWSVRSA